MGVRRDRQIERERDTHARILGIHDAKRNSEAPKVSVKEREAGGGGGGEELTD